jgi:hypothetical protein
MVCVGRDPHLREAVALISSWRGPRYADLLDDFPEKLKRID